ncbi:MAG TPA: Gfo/Idh/MocA family oxidoreductase [Steroidobacteraceae bacterium]|jgi:predicted dehydrogenase|nr:Gfo/Idh/MocA family oxidoreductase [Steroidobacteraceae bacterium]
MSKTLKWGLIGGGQGSQIGGSHRIAARMDGNFEMAAGALDVDAARAREFGVSLGIAADRAYGDWREMLEGERARADRLDLVTVATPNSTHFEITKAFLSAGFDVLCEKPLTTTVEEAETIVRTARDAGRICAVNYCYSGYPLVRHARALVARGDLGRVRVVVAEFAHGHHANAADADNPRVRWRYDPKLAGVSSVLADCGIHALHMACFITGQRVESLTADFASTIPSRQLEDDALLAFRMSGGAVGRLWTSAVAAGRMHGLNIQVFGEKAGLRWEQERPNQLYFTPVGGRTTTLERGSADLSAEEQLASRVAVGHAEGFLEAFANIYADLAEVLRARREHRPPNPLASSYPTAEDGLRSVAAVHAGAKSAKAHGSWVKL